MEKKPDLSSMANNQWDTDFDLDSVFAEEAQRSLDYEQTKEGKMELPQSQSFNSEGAVLPQSFAGNNTPQTQIPGDTSTITTPHPGYNNPAVPAPVTTTVDTPQVQTGSNFSEDELTLRNNATTNGLDPAFTDSGTTAPQQNQNQPSTTVTQQSTGDNQPQDQKDPYILALDIQKSLGLLDIPEDFKYEQLDEPTLMMLKEQTMIQHRKDALEFVRDKAGTDADTLRLFDYAIKGTKFSDIPAMQQTLQNKQVFSTFPIDTLENQKAMIEYYMRDGLDPNDPRNQFVIDSIPAQITKLEEQMQLKAKAEEAKKFFVNREEYEAQEHEKALQVKLQNEANIRAQEKATQDKWNNEFIDLLEKSEWSEGKKEAVKKEASLIQLKDGTTMPLWQYKQEIIFDNPALFQVFLDFTAAYNLETGKFQGQTINEAGEQTNETVQTLLNRITQKQNSSATATKGNEQPQAPGQQGIQPSMVDVDNDWFSVGQ